jgi:flagellin
MPIYGSTSLNLSSLSFGISKLGQHRADINKSLERLSTGKQINRASDDPSGLIASNKLHASKLSLDRRLTAFQRETSFLGAQEGALSVLSDLVIDLDALTVEAANTGALTQEEQDLKIDSAQSIITAINHIHNTSTFQGNNLLTGYSASDIGSVYVEETDPETGELVLTEKTLADLPQLLSTNPEAAQDLAKQAVATIAGRRGAIGNRLNSIESESNALLSELTNTEDALSLIEDADYAKETANLVRAQILEQATIQTMLTQQKQVESMLSLLTQSTSAISTTAPVSNKI